MQTAYLHIIVMLHAAFAAVFFFLNRQSPSRFARLFATCWAIEGIRAAILLPDLRAAVGGSQEHWFAAGDVLCFVANWCLLAGCADLAGVRLPRWLAPAYFWSGIPVVLFDRYGLPGVLAAWPGWPRESGRFYGIFANLWIMFVPVTAARAAVVVWLFRLWKKTRLPGALVVCGFGVPYAAVALAVPFQFYYDYSPDWISLLWCARVLGFSIGLVMLILDLQRLAAAKSEASLAAAQTLAKIGSWEYDATTGHATWSAEMFRLYGRDPAAGPMTYAEFTGLMPAAEREKFRREETQALAARRSYAHEFRVAHPDGTPRWISGRNTPFFNSAGELVRLIGVEQDITERKRAESRVELQHAVTRALADAEPLEPTMNKILEIIARGLAADYAGFWTFERTTQILRCAQLWQSPGKPLAEFTDLTRTSAFAPGVGLPGRLLAERRAIFVEEVELMQSENYPRRHAAERAGLKGGCGFPILLRAEIFGVVEFWMEETQKPDAGLLEVFGALGTQIGQFIERQRLEEQYWQSQKMEAVGTLAGGIAHDFNNILTAINGYCELARLDAPNTTVRAYLEAAQQAANRAADLVRQIMAFSRQGEQRRVPLALRAVVTEALGLLRATIPATVEIKAVEDDQLPLVLADATAIHQVVVNLGANASQAMKGRPGRLEVGLKAIAVDADFVATHPGLRPGRYVRLSVRDTGAGMDKATLARIFEPFFTTKGPGEGTGLGLAVVHGIVQSHDGAIFVYSEPGVGTQFQIYFPAHAGEAGSERKVAAPAVSRGQGERILFIDDEPMLARMGKKILERLGYVVEVYEDGANALAALRLRPGDFELVITDLTMPGMTGLEVAEEALRIRPDLPIILTSGYTATLTTERFREIGIREFLMKPHSFDSLGAAAHRALAAKDQN